MTETFFLGQWPRRKGSFEDPYPVYKEVKMLQCYEMALKTWSAWLETHVNRTKTQLFFVSNSATHSRYGDNLINELIDAFNTLYESYITPLLSNYEGYIYVYVYIYIVILLHLSGITNNI